MRKLILTLTAFVIVLTLSGIAHAQGEGNTIMLKFAGAPSGPCSFIMLGLNTVGNNLSICPSGTWVLVSGGGSGTVSNCTGAGNAFYSGAGTTVSCDTSITDSGTGQFTFTQGTITTSQPFISHTVTWNAGAVVFADLTQNITCTAAATTSNALGLGTGGTQWIFRYAAANCGQPQIVVPNSVAAQPAIAASGTSTGYHVSGNTLSLVRNGVSVFGIGGTSGSAAANNLSIGFASGAPDATAMVLGMSAMGGNAASSNPGFAFGTGAAGNEGALIRWNTCKPTSNITLSTSATTICTWSLPNVALTWSWECNGIYSITAGTTPTFSLGMNASQTPTSETGSAQIDTNGSGSSLVATNATATSASSGNQNILTGASVTTVTNAQFTTYGTLQPSATAGTFAITGTLGGTTPAGTVNVGTSCTLY